MYKKLAILCVVCLVSQAARSQTEGIRVDGVGEVRVAPDMAAFTFGIAGQTDTPDNAVARADAVSAELVRRLEELEVEQDDIQSTPVTMNPFRDRQSQRELVRYSRTTIAILRDMDRVEAVYRAALEAGVNSIGQIEYRVSNQDELRNQARDLALDDARMQAEAIAARLGVSVGRLLSVQMQTSRPLVPRFATLPQAAAEDVGGFSPEFRSGVVEIRQSASVAYEIIQP